MIIKKLSLDRRTLLRGLGAGVALPLMDAMEPALARAADKVAPVQRFGVAYAPNGMSMDYWTPKTTGAFELTPIMQPLAPFHDRLLAISGMNAPSLTASSPHSRSSTDFLTGTPPGKAPGGGGMTSISIDQMIAKAFGEQTQLPSLELGLDNIDGAGLCDANPCIMGNAISWHSPTLPLPPENNPRMVFERLFGDVGSTETAARLAHMRQDRSILDFVTANPPTFADNSDRTIAPGSPNIWTGCVISKPASRRPRRRAPRKCPSSISPSAFRRPSRSTPS